MISGQTLRVCPEGKPVSTFPDHALGAGLGTAGVSAAPCRRQAQRTMPVGIDEGQDFRNRRIRLRPLPYLVQTLGKDAGAVKQLLIERPYHREALAGELAASHADNIEARETRVLATRKTKRDHVAAHAACGPDHGLKPDPDELMGGGEAAHKNKIADLAVTAERSLGCEDHVVADLTILAYMPAVQEVTAISYSFHAPPADSPCLHGHLCPDRVAIADLKAEEC